MNRPALIAIVISVLVLACISSASALTVPEKLNYDVSWSGVSAGAAVQEVTVQGDDLHIVNTITSSGMVSMMLSIDDRTESVIPRSSTSGTQRIFRERINEGKTHSLKEGRFDFERLTVYTKDFLKKSEKTDAISPRTYDSLSSIYFIRSSQLSPGQTIAFDMYDFKRLWNVEVRVVKREEIKTPAGRFKTIVVTSQLKHQGTLAKVGNATVWLTDDSRRIPVKITTKLKIGEITLSLTGGSYWP